MYDLALGIIVGSITLAIVCGMILLCVAFIKYAIDILTNK